jgi:hypothetical protein
MIGAGSVAGVCGGMPEFCDPSSAVACRSRPPGFHDVGSRVEIELAEWRRLAPHTPEA